MQKVLTMSTLKESLRAEVQGWSNEDGDYVKKAYTQRLGTQHEYPHVNAVPVGLIGGSLQGISYPSVLHALGDGWKLLAPPRKYDYVTHNDERGNPVSIEMWDWWLVKD